jgi:uncharacterized damage-inducible protein DinB
MALKDALLAEYDHEMAATRKLLERIPDDKLTWKPHDKSRSFGTLGQHIANLPNWGVLVLDRFSVDLLDVPTAPAEPQSRSLILSAFDEARAKTRKLLDKTDAELAAMWSLKREGQELFSLPKSAAFRTFVISHIVHHRGQLSVYLRLNDIPVPALYGPSADEGGM